MPEALNCLHIAYGYLQEVVTGITTGQLLCACVGSRVRSEYTVYGNAINLSARLMVKAQEGLAGMLCDSTTHELAHKAAVFTKLDPIQASRSQAIVPHKASDHLADGIPGASRDAIGHKKLNDR